MNNTRMSHHQYKKSNAKRAIDTMIDADYEYLRQNPQHNNAIMQCSIVQRTPLIKQYIEELEVEYNIPSPLKRSSKMNSSRKSGKKLQVSLRRSSARESVSKVEERKHERKLTLTTSNHRQSEPLSLTKKQSFEQRQPLITPKFGQFGHFSHYERPNINFDSRLASSQIRPAQEYREYQSQGRHSPNIIFSKEKPKNIQLNTYNEFNETPKRKIVTFQSENRLNAASGLVIETAKSTVKKYPNQRMYSEGSIEPSSSFNQQLHTISHKNPAKKKMKSREKSEESRSVIKDSYRYCVGCQLPILSANIKEHENSCQAFKQLSILTNQDLLEALKKKIALIEEKIPEYNKQCNPWQIQTLKTSSVEVIQQTRNRQTCSQQSPRFKQHYGRIMDIGKKWCLSLEEVNKLRWFSRIVSKLQQLIRQSQ